MTARVKAMAVEQFTFDQLDRMDGGRLRAAFEKEFRLCEADCHDRPGLGNTRSVTMKLELRPECADNGELSTIDVSFAFEHSVPKRKSRRYNMLAAPGGLLFNDASPEDVRQRTLDMAEQVGPKEVVGDAG